MYNKAVQIAREEGDDTSRVLFSLLLKDEEEHVEWLESQLHQMKELGYETYLSNQTEGEKG
jgi:bacterioferritin